MSRQQKNDESLQDTEEIKGKFKRGLNHNFSLGNRFSLAFTSGQGQLGKKIYGRQLS